MNKIFKNCCWIIKSTLRQVYPCNSLLKPSKLLDKLASHDFFLSSILPTEVGSILNFPPFYYLIENKYRHPIEQNVAYLLLVFVYLHINTCVLFYIPVHISNCIFLSYALLNFKYWYMNESLFVLINANHKEQ